MATEFGVNILDTAIGYGGSEVSIGKWMSARNNRKDNILITKGCHPGPEGKRVTPKDLADDLFRSLERLETDYIDIYLLHRDDLDLPVDPIVDALNEHFAAGRIKSFGGSNWTHQRIQEANDYAAKNGLEPFRVRVPAILWRSRPVNPGPPARSPSADRMKSRRANGMPPIRCRFLLIPVWPEAFSPAWLPVSAMRPKKTVS